MFHSYVKFPHNKPSKNVKTPLWGGSVSTLGASKSIKLVNFLLVHFHGFTCQIHCWLKSPILEGEMLTSACSLRPRLHHLGPINLEQDMVISPVFVGHCSTRSWRIHVALGSLRSRNQMEYFGKPRVLYENLWEQSTNGGNSIAMIDSSTPRGRKSTNRDPAWTFDLFVLRCHLGGFLGAGLKDPAFEKHTSTHQLDLFGSWSFGPNVESIRYIYQELAIPSFTVKIATLRWTAKINNGNDIPQCMAKDQSIKLPFRRWFSQIWMFFPNQIWKYMIVSNHKMANVQKEFQTKRHRWIPLAIVSYDIQVVPLFAEVWYQTSFHPSKPWPCASRVMAFLWSGSAKEDTNSRSSGPDWAALHGKIYRMPSGVDPSKTNESVRYVKVKIELIDR